MIIGEERKQERKKRKEVERGGEKGDKEKMPKLGLNQGILIKT